MKSAIIALALLIGTVTANAQYQLTDFFDYNPNLEAKVDSVFQSISDEQRVGQLLVQAAGDYGRSDAHLAELIRNGKIGGVLLLNGSKGGFTNLVSKFDSIAKANGQLPLSYSADAEPSLIRYKIKGSTPVKNAINHTGRQEVRNTAKTICQDLHEIGITQNYAPVIDVSAQNEAIGNRSFGDNRDTVIAWSKEFVKVTQDENIIATVKHFPGHGQVKGDTHKKLVFIDGELNEVPNYKPLIDAGALSIMVGHIAVKNNEKYNTDGLPATCSDRIVTDLLKNEMGFKGLIITDAMGMGGVKKIPHNGLKAVEAGCDILLMPTDEDRDIEDIINKMESNEVFRQRVYASVKKVIRLKILQGIIT